AHNVHVTRNLIPPLSLITDGTSVPAVGHEENISISDASSAAELPVWMYWEGECPAWIRECQQTVFKHAPRVELLTPEKFDALWDCDRDIDLTRLHVAHRADFIRAFLLAKHGGLWIDSDCLVMQPLAPVLERLQHYDFVCHRERQGHFSNGF